MSSSKLRRGTGERSERRSSKEGAMLLTSGGEVSGKEKKIFAGFCYRMTTKRSVNRSMRMGRVWANTFSVTAVSDRS